VSDSPGEPDLRAPRNPRSPGVRTPDFAALHPGYRPRESESAPAKTTLAQCLRGFLPIRRGIGHSLPCFFQACRRRGIALEQTGSGVCPADLGFHRAARFLPLTMGWTDARGRAIGDFPPSRWREICTLFQMVTGYHSGLAGSPGGGKKLPASAPSLSVFLATPRRKLHFRLFKGPLRRCLREPVG
jgi:hypothetical protein